MSIKKFLQKRLARRTLSESDSEMLHYRRFKNGASSRFHLRIDSNGEGILFANAKSAVRLHPSGAIIAQGVLDGLNDDSLLKELRKAFRSVNDTQAREDIQKVRKLIERMEASEVEFSLSNLADPTFAPESSPLLRPLTADVPLCKLSSMEAILRRLWAEQIPHVTILCGNDPDEADLIRAVEKAEDIGLITGVRGRGSDLRPFARVQSLAHAGLDHLDVICASADEEKHDALFGPGDYAAAVQTLVAARRLDVCPTALIPLLRITMESIDGLLTELTANGVTNAGIFSLVSLNVAAGQGDVFHPDEILQIFEMIEDAAARNKMNLVWHPPTLYKPEESTAIQAMRGPRTSGDFSVRIEPAGDVFVSRGPRVSAGNILEESWEKIAAGQVYASFRERMELRKRCDACPSLALCVADCFLLATSKVEE